MLRSSYIIQILYLFFPVEVTLRTHPFLHRAWADRNPHPKPHIMRLYYTFEDDLSSPKSSHRWQKKGSFAWACEPVYWQVYC